MPFTQKEEVAVLSFVEVCSLDLAEALESDQKMGESLPDRSLWPTVLGSQPHVILEPNCIQNPFLNSMSYCPARGRGEH